MNKTIQIQYNFYGCLYQAGDYYQRVFFKGYSIDSRIFLIII